MARQRDESATGRFESVRVAGRGLHRRGACEIAWAKVFE
jgi:hypothetical protein